MLASSFQEFPQIAPLADLFQRLALRLVLAHYFLTPQLLHVMVDLEWDLPRHRSMDPSLILTLLNGSTRRLQLLVLVRRQQRPQVAQAVATALMERLQQRPQVAQAVAAALMERLQQLSQVAQAVATALMERLQQLSQVAQAVATALMERLQQRPQVAQAVDSVALMKIELHR